MAFVKAIKCWKELTNDGSVVFARVIKLYTILIWHNFSIDISITISEKKKKKWDQVNEHACARQVNDVWIMSFEWDYFRDLLVYIISIWINWIQGFISRDAYIIITHPFIQKKIDTHSFYYVCTILWLFLFLCFFNIWINRKWALDQRELR